MGRTSLALSGGPADLSACSPVRAGPSPVGVGPRRGVAVPCDAVPVTTPPGRPDTERLIAAVAAESALLAEEFARVLPGDPVPTCPRWTAAELVGHLGGVQRWATEIVAHARTSNPSDEETAALFEVPQEAASADRDAAAAALRGWFRVGGRRAGRRAVRRSGGPRAMCS